jgi:capsule biosynthesis phosphatase
MIITILLGGIGQRFKDNGYTYPKALIKANGEPILFKLLNSIRNYNFNSNDKIIIPYNYKEYCNYNLEHLLNKEYPELNFYFIKIYNSIGPYDTFYKAFNKLKLNDCPMLILDCDNHYTFNIINKWNKDNQIFSFIDKQSKPLYSYIRTENNNVIDIKEKEKISDIANTGAYGFLSWKSLINKEINMKSSIAQVIGEMIKSDIRFEFKIIEKEDYICLGTPIQLMDYCNKVKSEKKRFVFDLDNTLVSYPTIQGDYTSVEPIQRNINYLNYLYDNGHYIIIHTARRMKTHNGNIGSIIKDIGQITFDTLNKYKIKYHELLFGKPYADFYIDDNAINGNNDISKDIGFYINDIECRDFHDIKKTNETYIKTGKNLFNEYNYYQTMNKHDSVQKYFPHVINYSRSNTFDKLELEKINGVNLSKLFTSGNLTLEIFNKLLIAIHEIQQCIEIELFTNYNYLLKDKIIERYNNYDYSKYENSELILNEIINYKYKVNNYRCIHGDPVFSNILIENENIKLIDPRGKIKDNEYFVKGHCLYDYAKIYQSIIGYDEIINKQFVNDKYRNQFKDRLFKEIIKHYGHEAINDLKNITKSLLLSLIPLHDNDNCNLFYDLINRV